VQLVRLDKLVLTQLLQDLQVRQDKLAQVLLGKLAQLVKQEHKVIQV